MDKQQEIKVLSELKNSETYFADQFSQEEIDQIRANKGISQRIDAIIKNGAR